MDIEEILQDAIQGEIESYDMYTWAAGLVRAEHVKQMLHDLAQQEVGHRMILERMMANPAEISWRVRDVQQAPVQDYQIGDHLVIKPLGPNSTFQDVLIVASKKEQQAHELYQGLAARAEGPARDLLLAIAKDELRHKNLVERWYEEAVYQEF
jgi:rubrerythrin